MKPARSAIVLCMSLGVLPRGVDIDSAALAAGQSQKESAAPVQCEFRVFDGADEVTAETRVRVYPSGTREAGATVDAGQARVTLPAGIYDAQAIRQRQGQVLNIRWAERLVIMPYPDEQGLHLEIINFKPRFGALQLRPGGTGATAQSAYDAVVYAAGERAREAARPIAGEDYVLFVIPAGRYDVRVRVRPRPGGEAADRWLLDVEIPEDRMRLKRIEGE